MSKKMIAEIGTQADYARHLGKSRPYITKLIKQGRIPVRKDGRINFAKADMARQASADPARSEAIATDGSYTKARAEREEFNARLAKIAYERAVKKVLPKESVEHALVDCSRVIARQIESLVAEAENIEAAARANGVKGVRLHLKKCVRDIRQRTTLINAMRAHMAEFGIVAGIGRNGVEKLLELIGKGEDERIPPVARECLMALAAQLELVKCQILEADRRVLAWHRTSKTSKRLEAIPGVGPLVATALVASIPDPRLPFRP